MKRNLRNLGFVLALGAISMVSCSEANEAAEHATDAAHGAVEHVEDAAHKTADKAEEVVNDTKEAVEGEMKCEAGKCGDGMAKDATEGEKKCEAGKCGDGMAKDAAKEATDHVEDAAHDAAAH